MDGWMGPYVQPISLGGVSTKELAKLESAFLNLLEFNLMVHPKEFYSYLNQLENAFPVPCCPLTVAPNLAPMEVDTHCLTNVATEYKARELLCAAYIMQELLCTT